MKNTKRILEVKIVREIDTDPDTSYYGEYSNKPDSEFSIDRATDEFVGDVNNGRDWLERVENRLQDEYNELDETNLDAVWLYSLEAAINIVNGLRTDAPFEDDSVSWNSREYRYFNPSDNYKGEPAEDIRKYVRQDFERMEAYNRGHWYYTGTYATAEVGISTTRSHSTGEPIYTVQTIRSGGLWGTESDSDASHFESIEQEELSALRDQLKALGFSARAISTAFKNVKVERD